MSQAHQSLFKIFGIITNKNVCLYLLGDRLQRLVHWTPPHHFLDSKWSYSTNFLGCFGSDFLSRRYGGRQHNDAGTQNILYDEDMKFPLRAPRIKSHSKKSQSKPPLEMKKIWINGLNNQTSTGARIQPSTVSNDCFEDRIGLRTAIGSSHLCT